MLLSFVADSEGHARSHDAPAARGHGFRQDCCYNVVNLFVSGVVQILNYVQPPAAQAWFALHSVWLMSHIR